VWPSLKNPHILQVEAIPAASAPMPVTPAPAPSLLLLHLSLLLLLLLCLSHLLLLQLPLPFITHPDDGEWIDINNVSGSEDDNDPPKIIANLHTHQCPLQTTTSTLPTNPFATKKRN
jgi:hypothetical protein